MSTNGVNGASGLPQFNPDDNKEQKFEPENIQDTISIFGKLEEAAKAILKDHDATGDGLVDEADCNVYNSLIQKFAGLSEALDAYMYKAPDKNGNMEVRKGNFKKLWNTDVIGAGTNAWNYYKNVIYEKSEALAQQLKDLAQDVMGKGANSYTQEQANVVAKFAASLDEYNDIVKGKNAYDVNAYIGLKAKITVSIESAKAEQTKAQNAGQTEFAAKLGEAIATLESKLSNIETRIEMASLAQGDEEALEPTGVDAGTLVADAKDAAQKTLSKILGDVDLAQASEIISSFDKNENRLVQQWEFDEARGFIDKFSSYLNKNIQVLEKVFDADLSEEEAAVYKPALQKLYSLQKQLKNATKTDHNGPSTTGWEARRGHAYQDTFGAWHKGNLSTSDLNKVLVFYSDKDGYIKDTSAMEKWIASHSELTRDDADYLRTCAKYPNRPGTLMGGNHPTTQELVDKGRAEIMAKFAEDIQKMWDEQDRRQAEHAKIINERNGQAIAKARAEEHEVYINMYKD